MIGKVQLRDELGRGADCLVFTGYDTVIYRTVAVKLLDGTPCWIPRIASQAANRLSSKA